MSVQWNFCLDFRCEDTKVTELDRYRFLTRPYNKMYSVTDLRWNSFESWAVAACQRAVATMLSSLGLPTIAVPNNRIHIVSRVEYDRKVCDLGLNDLASFSAGHIYVPREKDRARFFNSLSHEISHQVAFYGLRVRRRSWPIEEVTYHVQMMQCGLIQWREDFQKHFHAYGEAATEMFAKMIRHIACDGDHQLTAAETHAVKYLTAYGWSVQLVERLIDRCVSRRRSAPELYDQLFRDHVRGEYTLLRVFNRRLPGTSRVLRMLAPSESKVRRATKVLFRSR
jgi:hypothetical protein